MMSKFNKMLRENRGFTLVELIVVIAVLGILAGIAVPRLTGVQDKAKNSAIMTSAGSIRDSMEMYKSENGEYPSEDDIGSWDDLDDELDTTELPEVGEDEGQIPISGENFSYSVDNSEDQFIITLESSLNDNDYEVYIGEKAVVDSNGDTDATDASELDNN